MSIRFELAYLFGYTPWDRWRGKPLRMLREIFEGPQALRPGRALDIGCGRGQTTIYLAQIGWRAVGIDPVERALRVARRRAERAGVKVEFVRGNIADPEEAGIAGPFDLFVDIGCFHILYDKDRRSYAASLSRLAAPESELVMFAFSPNRDVIGPRGAKQSDIEHHLSADWRVVWSAVDTHLPYRIPRGAVGTWYRLRRRGREALNADAAACPGYAPHRSP